jgi:type IV secretion system protein VirD4
LDFVSTWEDARTLTEAMIPPGTGNEKFWDDSARDLVTGLVMFVKGWDLDKRNMREVVGLLYSGKEEFAELLEMMREQGEKDRQMAETANAIAGTPENTRDGILTTARTHLQVWRDPAIERATSMTDWHAPGLKQTTYEHFKIAAMIRDNPSAAQFGNVPSGDTVYLCLPQDKVRTYAPVLRVILSQHVAMMTGGIFSGGEFKPPVPVLFVLDELPQLGYMKPIEDAISIVRSADIRLWLFVQDIDQLRAAYPQWRSIAANCQTQIFFNIRENETARYVSDKLGTMRDLLRGETRPVADPAELMGPAFKDRMIIFQGNNHPAVAHKYYAYEIPGVKDMMGRVQGIRLAREDFFERQRQPPAG